VAGSRTISGSSLVTGRRYTVQPGGSIYVQGSSLTYFPGTTAGTPSAISSVGVYGN
jgi:hypothetical protein